MEQSIISKLIHRFQFGDDQAPEEETIANIESGIVFKGAKLWVLILAIFVASLGLNTNSTAVIIGAMLISPLMGPILGMGLSAGIHDFTLLKKAFKNYFVATLFSVGTAALYFFLSPFEEAQSELLARTSPTIYDVLIALCGGLAGIIALSSKSQRSGNVIPGVAIATALMPPLCTVGYGLATANWLYALGALYLYVINTVFISLATYIGVEFIFKFSKRAFLDRQKERKFKYITFALLLFIIIPSMFLTFIMVRKSLFETNARRFCKEAVNIEGAHLIGSETDFRSKTMRLIFMGEEVDSTAIRNLEAQLEAYSLGDVSLSVIQGASGIDEETVKNMMKSSQDHLIASSQMIAADEKKIEQLEAELEPYRSVESLTSNILDEMKTLFPNVTALTLARGNQARTSDNTSEAIIAIYEVKGKLKEQDQVRLKEWLGKRLNRQNIMIIQKN